MTQTRGGEIYAGLMSGTSLDGVDIAVVDFSEYPPVTVYSGTTPYDAGLRQRLRDLTHSQTTTLDALFGLDAELSQVYADVVATALERLSLAAEDVTALGCHGQTVRHRPDAAPPYTAQLGDPGRLAVLSGICTVADFRRKDIALGGQGAPLAPAFHRFLLHSDSENRAVINIGGIANVTILPADKDLPIYGSDTGPGNTLLDHWIARHRAADYDANGDWARCGRVVESLLRSMLDGEPFFRLAAPKSTGTEYFNPAWLDPWLTGEADPRDVQATLTELTARTIAMAIRDTPIQIHKCFVCGGGAHNRFLLERLGASLDGTRIDSTAALGVDPDFVEASAFAWLARCRLRGTAVDLTDVTGASRATLLGGIYTAD